ncbi:hypothetical protein [Kribbella sp. NPDC003557]|uniref:hypothetical protein n=1 Tax=Kribbella sp. NPDC003557 TaxID=3154449 RepID=UPI0033A27622
MADSVQSVVAGGAALILTALARFGDTAAAAALSQTERIAVLVVGGLVILGLYLLACAVWPYANCDRCDGSGKSRSPSGRTFRNCPRCKGLGRRERIGRRLLNHTNKHR